jgi:hypothetical protein
MRVTRFWATAVVALSLGVAGCGSSSSSGSAPSSPSSTSASGPNSLKEVPAKQRYPADVETGFLSSCDRTSNGQKAYCQCALAHIEKTTSYDDFAQNSLAVQRGQAKVAPSEIAAQKACAFLAQ